MRIVFSDESRRDLRDITGFIAADSCSRARSYVAELASARTARRSATALSTHTELSIVSSASPAVCNHAIIYFADGDVVTIVRVLHSAMDLSSALGD